MDIRGVERFILVGYDREKAVGYRIKVRQCAFGVLWCLIAVSLLIWGLEIRLISAESSLLGFTIRFGLHPAAYIISTLLICFVVLLVVKFGRMVIRELSESINEAIAQQVRNKNRFPIKALVGGLVFFLGLALVRALVRAQIIVPSGQIVRIILCIIVALLILFFAFTYLYKFYLITKYCPYLKRIEDRQYPEDKGYSESAQQDLSAE